MAANIDVALDNSHRRWLRERRASRLPPIRSSFIQYGQRAETGTRSRRAISSEVDQSIGRGHSLTKTNPAPASRRPVRAIPFQQSNGWIKCLRGGGIVLAK